MNAIINGFQDEGLFKAIEQISESLPLHYAALIYQYKRYKMDIETDYFDWEDLIWSANYRVDWNNIAPLDEDIIEKMSLCEVAVLKMMDRLETRKNYSYQERKDLYLKHLCFWNDFIDKKKINLFISSNIPHEVFDYIIYSLCKIKGVQCVFMYQSHIPDTIIVMSDWEKSSESLKEKYDYLLEISDKSGSKAVDLPLNFENYFQKHKLGKEDTTPFYMKKKKSKEFLSGLSQSFSNRMSDNPSENLRVAFQFANNLFRNLISSGPEKKIFNFYEKNCQNFDQNQKYIYFPLHYQPELTTSPCAGAFVEQLVAVQLLASCLPKNYLVYVKEHPKQKLLGRNRYFYNELMKINNVRLISRRINSNALIDHSVAVATCIGTAGWEALFRGKQVIMFGHDFYQYAPGVFTVRTKEDCNRAVKNIVEKKDLPSDYKLRLFLKALSQVVINGYIDSAYRRETQLSELESVKNIADSLTRYIKTNK